MKLALLLSHDLIILQFFETVHECFRLTQHDLFKVYVFSDLLCNYIQFEREEWYHNSM
jgi:hypothetical protein